MHKSQHLELLETGLVTRMRLMDERPAFGKEAAELAKEWNGVVDRTHCRTLIMDCSNIAILTSEMLSKLVLLERRLKQQHGSLVLSGLRPEIREVLSWTKLDRFFQIEEEAETVAAIQEG